MIHPSTRLLFALITLLVWTGASTTLGNCDDPLGGSNCQNQNLNTNDDPPGNECGGTTVVTSSSSSGTTLVVNLSNPSESTEEGFVVATVLIGGHAYESVLPVTVTAESTQSLLFVFSKTFTIITVDPCSTKPGGINEGPDVVGLKNEEQPE